MARTERGDNNIKSHEKLITIILVLELIFPATAMSAQEIYFNCGNSIDKTKLDSDNQWQQWKDEQGEPFYINHDIRKAQKECPEQLEGGKNDLVTEIPYPQTIQEKIKLFNAQIDKSTYIDDYGKKFIIRVERSKIFKNSYYVVMSYKAKKKLRKMLRLEFKDEINTQLEESLAKEWFSLLSKEISDPKKGFFRYVDEDNYQLEINPKSKSSIYSYFKFIGRVVGAAVYHQIPLNIFFVKPYYKTMLSKPIELADVESADPMYYRNLLKADVDTLREYVSAIRKPKNKTKTELISKIIRKKYQTSVQKQMSDFLKGFSDLIPLHLLRIFTADELKELIGGVQSIDVDDWMENTKYYYNANDRTAEVITWFWKIVREFSDEEKRRLLQFVVGTPTVPAIGFQALKPMFTIIIDCCEKVDRIPTAGVCSNKITLTDYTSEESLKKLLQKAIEIAYSFLLG